MRLLDPLTGIRLAYGNWILHLGYLISILMIPAEESCNWRYSSCKIVLLVSHALEIVFTTIGLVFKKFGFHFFSHASEGFSMFLYHGAIFWVQN